MPSQNGMCKYLAGVSEKISKWSAFERKSEGANMKNATACPFLGGGTPGLLSVEGKSSKAHLIADEF